MINSLKKIPLLIISMSLAVITTSSLGMNDKTIEEINDMIERSNGTMDEADKFIAVMAEAERVLAEAAAQEEESSSEDEIIAQHGNLVPADEGYFRVDEPNPNIFGPETSSLDIAANTPTPSLKVHFADEVTNNQQPAFLSGNLQYLVTANGDAFISANPDMPHAAPGLQPVVQPPVSANSDFAPQGYAVTGRADPARLASSGLQPVQPIEPAPELPRQPVQPVQPVQQQQPAVQNKIEQATLEAILNNILNAPAPMITAGTLGVVHYLYENQVFNQAIAVRSPKVKEYLHEYILPIAREALAAHLIQLLLPHLPYLSDKNIRSYGTANYLGSFITTKILGSTALYLTKMVTQTEQGKKLVKQYKRLPKKTKETIAKIIPWIDFIRNVFMARSIANYLDPAPAA